MCSFLFFLSLKKKNLKENKKILFAPPLKYIISFLSNTNYYLKNAFNIQMIEKDNFNDTLADKINEQKMTRKSKVK